MIKRVIRAATAALGILAALNACQQDRTATATPDRVPDGYVALRFDAEIPAMQEVVTRSVDPDGNGVQNMTLFCFDSFGLFISTATADLSAQSSETGTFSAVVPENTRTIHFLANQNMSEFQEDDFRSHSEAEVMSVLEGSSGRMIYWARFACAPDDDRSIDEQLAAAGNAVEMIRNHARISIANPDNQWLEVTGFVPYNTNAFGTVAPFLRVALAPADGALSRTAVPSVVFFIGGLLVFGFVGNTNGKPVLSGVFSKTGFSGVSLRRLGRRGRPARPRTARRRDGSRPWWRTRSTEPSALRRR